MFKPETQEDEEEEEGKENYVKTRNLFSKFFKLLAGLARR